jgi:predicted  nucleic acid-binding Zn-ribbon protein
MTLAATLFRLEQVDTEIERAEATLHELERRQTRNPALQVAETRLDALQATLRTAETEQRARESDLNDLEARIKRDHTRLYSGQIVDPRELGSIERELQHSGRRRDTLEEECLEGMERVEELQAQLTTTRQEVQDLRTRWEESAPARTRQLEQLRTGLTRLRAERESLMQTTDARAIEMYTRLRSALGHAVSQINGGVCEVCRVTLTPRDVQHARGSDLTTCTNCGSILYAG